MECETDDEHHGWNVPTARILEGVDRMNEGFDGTGFSFRLIVVSRTLHESWSLMVDGDTDESIEAMTALAIDPGRVLNLYVSGMCDRGWARYPWDAEGNERRDGIAVRGWVVADEPHRGTTLSHEAGHWLGLCHTYEGGCTGPGDHVDDTPPLIATTADTSYTACESRVYTCGGDDPDPIDNIMGYHYRCRNRFTSDQTERMRRAVTLYRYALSEDHAFEEDVELRAGTTWELFPGTLRFAAGSRLIVRGELTAAGVTFTEAATGQGWGGIVAAGAQGRVELSGGSVVEHADAGVTVYEPAHTEITGSTTALRDNEIGLLVLSNGGGTAPGATVDGAEIVDNGTGGRTDFTCTWDSGAFPSCSAFVPTPGFVRIDDASVSGNTGVGAYVLNGNAWIENTCFSANGASGLVAANGAVDPFLFNTLIENGASSDGHAVFVHAAGNVQFGTSQQIGRNRVLSNATSEVFVWEGGTAFIGFGPNSGENRITDGGGLVYASTGVDVPARRTFWGGGAPPTSGFPGPGDVDRADHRTSDPTSDACSIIESMAPQAGSGGEAFAGGAGEHGAEIRRVRELIEADPGAAVSEGLVRRLVSLQRADPTDFFGEETMTRAALTALRRRLDAGTVPASVRPAAEAALEAEVTDALARGDYPAARALLAQYSGRVTGDGVRRSLTVIQAYLVAHEGRRAEAAALVEAVAAEERNPAAARELTMLAAALADEFGSGAGGFAPDGPGLAVVATAQERGLRIVPNPVSGAATVQLVLEAPAGVMLVVYDVLGRVVAEVAEGDLPSGAHALVLDTPSLPAGMYVVRGISRSAGGSERLYAARFTVVR